MQHDPDDPAASASTFRDRFVQPQDLAAFRDWIASDIPVELEIGSGKGLFLTNAAKENQAHRFVGLELATKYALECQARIDKLGIPNAKFYACDAVEVMEHDVLDNSIQAIHVYFPDPWWKSRHKKRRVLSEKTLRNIERCLVPEGELHFWTDVLDYYESTLELIEQITHLSGPYFVSEPPAVHDMDYRTHFERRTRRHGLPVYRARFTRVRRLSQSFPNQT
ncbi:MAG: tRNA (guanosine(46)-N7)-methyltransferase TrmB [Pirellula sp.]